MNNRLFDFVRQFSEELADLANRLEDQLFEQPNSSLIQARLFCEEFVKKMSQSEGLEKIYPLKPVERINKLFREDLIPEDIYTKLNTIRRMGNKAAHDVKEAEYKDVLDVHKLLFEISVWYMEVYGSHEFTAPEYKIPLKTEINLLDAKNVDELIKPYIDQSLGELREELQRHLEAMKTEKGNSETGKTKGMDKIGAVKEPLSEVKKNEITVFSTNNFEKTYETTKAIEFTHKTSKEIVYLNDNNVTSILLNPLMVEQNEALKSKGKIRNSTALRHFPKHQNNGENLIHYGYQFQFTAEAELDSFLKRLNELLVRV
ncbi:DUF4145 domain-containing protein [Paenibacillus sp. BSR1-1]|uniref:DUF4145 domain-containing protein n=1 Tax=Paenibacillus sp. BSR1-1 TaxID=3020845 RepID=UPI0025AF4739|nr:DUF4145 domain-containing protein [Paenibacillus sp. BSR1-1]MDN3015494.1 DUF4145 domain-containing protein [Paenibacillus sp. BSR1-1]